MNVDRDMLLAGIENGLLDIAIMIGEASYRGLMSRSFWSEQGHPAQPNMMKYAGTELNKRRHW